MFFDEQYLSNCSSKSWNVVVSVFGTENGSGLIKLAASEAFAMASEEEAMMRLVVSNSTSVHADGRVLDLRGH